MKKKKLTFVAIKSIIYIEVVYSARDEKILKRELETLKTINNHNPEL